MKDFFTERSLFLIGGPGGVGKTTFAAAIGVQLATHGYRTVVLTVDPAKRLAQTLGLSGLENEIQEVPIPGAPSMLFATMLDSQRYFDRVIEKFATSPGQKEKIIQNPLYRTLVDNLGGTHEYAAMERLLEFANDKRFEKIVIDTPPSHNAVDLFSAPQRLADFMDSNLLRWFKERRSHYFHLFLSGSKLGFSLIRKIFGHSFMDSLSHFFGDLEGMQAGFRNRNREVMELLKSSRSAFLLVTHPSEVRYQESIQFQKTLQENGIDLNAIYLNRVEPTCITPNRMPRLDLSIRQKLEPLLQFYSDLSAQDRYWTKSFQEAFAPIPCQIIERQSGDLQNITALSQLGNQIV